MRYYKAAEGGIIDDIRNYVLAHNGLGGVDDKEAQTAMNVDASSDTVKSYAKGGVVTPYPEIEQERDEEGTEASSDESNDEEFEEMPHMDDGGFIAPPPPTDSGDDYNVGTGDSSTVKAQQLNPAAIRPPVVAPPPAAAAPAQKMPTVVPAARPVNPRPLPGMPPNVTPDELEQYLNKQRAAIGKYSPDQEFAQEQALLKARTGIGGSLANAGAGLADAIMQGVARAGNPGFQEKLQNQQNAIAEEATGAIERGRAGTLQQMQAEQAIDTQDPKSTLSRTYQKAYAPVFQMMGYSPKSVMSMPASQIQTLADLGVRYADAQTQLALKKATLNVQSMTAAANMANLRSEREEEALKTLEGMPWYSRFMHPGISGALEKEAGISDQPSYTPDVLAFSKAHNISPDQAQAIKAKRLNS